MSTEYGIWNNIKGRCFRVKVPDYRRYGGRGITMCDRWRDSFAAFYADMGPRPSLHHSIDRIDNDGPYAPGNCRWATWIEQRRNRKDHLTTVELDGESRLICDWAKVSGVREQCISSRLRRGWPVREAIFRPACPKQNGRRSTWVENQ